LTEEFSGRAPVETGVMVVLVASVDWWNWLRIIFASLPLHQVLSSQWFSALVPC
jgi:hypothetical protein